MSKQASCPFDHNGIDYAKNWPEINSDLRRLDGLGWSEAHGGFWIAARYDDVSTIARDGTHFSQERGSENGKPTLGAFIPTTPVGLVPIETDPPVQSEIRRRLNPAFTIKVAMRWKPAIRRIADTMIDRIIEKGSADLVKDVTKPIPAIVNFQSLGIPLEGWEEAIDSPGVLTYADPASPEFAAALAAVERTKQNIIRAVQERHARPRADLLTVISQLNIDGRPIDQELVVNLVQALVSGGNGTTTGLMSHSLHWLGNHPEDRARLAAGPELIPGAVEEFLRYFSPVQTMARHAVEPTCIAGTTVSRGQRVLMNWAAANRDAEVFPDPDRVIIDRKRNRHLAFGIGSHHCIGFNVARVMAQTTIEAVLARMPDYIVDNEHTVYMAQIPVVNGVRSLPATFTPGPSIGASIPREDEYPQLPQSVLDAIAAGTGGDDASESIDLSESEIAAR
ncbi:MAG: cytochrome P450 [Actinobacteria bacterium]|nr:cytochrome P450 [Actinomycetota bacterium]